MKLIFKVPLEFSIVGPSPESLNIPVSFKHKSCVVRVSFFGKDEPNFLESLPSNEKYFKGITQLSFEIEADESTKKGKELLNQAEDKDKHYDLLLFLTKVVNRVLRNIRNFGIVPHIHEIGVEPDKIEAFLYRWSVEISVAGKEAMPLSKMPEDRKDMIKFIALLHVQSREHEFPVLYISNWPEIKEAIQDNLQSPLENELLTNTHEFLRVGNNKMAILESVTCLDIILSQYLKIFLTNRKNLDTKRIGKFLTTQFGLTARIAGLLDLTLSKESLKYVNIEGVLQAIKWRNDIVHKYGHLPSGVSNNDLKQAIEDTLNLIYILVRERDQIIAEPSLIGISENIAKKYNIPTPTILLPGPKHKINVKINFLFETPDKKNFKAICEDLIEIFKNRDPRFNESEHLLVTFIKFPNKTLAYWLNNKLNFI